MRAGMRPLLTTIAAPFLVLVSPAAAQAAATLSLAGPVTIETPRTVTVPISASCDPVGQETTFIVVTVAQGTIQKSNYVDGQGDVLNLTCDSMPHLYDVVVSASFGRPAWRPGDAALTAIISYCDRAEDGTLSCTTQALIPAGTTIKLTRR